jgi:hypothetical protein
VDPDHVLGGYRVHAGIVVRWQVNPHHRDQVTAVLARAIGRQQQQFPCALHAEERSRTWSLA